MQDLQEMQFRFLGWEDPLEEEMATHSSIFARIIPWNLVGYKRSEPAWLSRGKKSQWLELKE